MTKIESVVSEKFGLPLCEVVDFFSSEDLVCKVQALHHASLVDPYSHVDSTTTAWDRALLASERIPKEHKLAFFALMSNIIYIPSQLIRQFRKYLAEALAKRCLSQGIKVPWDVQIFSIDNPGLLDEMFREGAEAGWGSREDYMAEFGDFRRITQLLTVLQSPAGLSDHTIKQIKALFSKKAWVFLADLSLSGKSVSSDIERAKELISWFSKNAPPKIMIACEVVTSKAIERTKNLVDQPDLDFFWGSRFDDRFSIKSDLCSLFYKKSTLVKVREFCEWFGDLHFKPLASELEVDDDPFKASYQAHRRNHGQENFAFGWGDCGLTIVTSSNSPNNSVPPIWYPVLINGVLHRSKCDYKAIFTRSPSRTSYRKSNANDLFEIVKGKKSEILERLGRN